MFKVIIIYNYIGFTLQKHSKIFQKRLTIFMYNCGHPETNVHINIMITLKILTYTIVKWLG